MRGKKFHPLISKAHEFAKLYHGGVTRKYYNVPYFFHVMQVANILHMLAPNDIALICAGYCHDLIEDTDISFEIIEKEFNFDVAELVIMVTDDKSKYKEYDEKNYRVGKKKYQTLKLSTISDRAVLLKLTDIYCNLSDVFTVPEDKKDWASEYISEKKYIIDNYYRDNDKSLYLFEREILTSKIYNIIDLFYQTQRV